MILIFLTSLILNITPIDRDSFQVQWRTPSYENKLEFCQDGKPYYVLWLDGKEGNEKHLLWKIKYGLNVVKLWYSKDNYISKIIYLSRNKDDR